MSPVCQSIFMVVLASLATLIPTPVQGRVPYEASSRYVPIPPRPVNPPVCPVFHYDAIYDLEGQTISPNPHVTVVEGLSGAGCSTKGVLKLALASATEDAGRRRVLVDLFFKDPSGWVFNLGDSSTNNGYAGDAATQFNDAEFHGNGRSLHGWYNQYSGSGKSLTLPNLYNRRLSLIAGDGHLVWLSDNPEVDSYNYKAHQGLFALNGQADDEGPVNYDLYLGMNKVIQRFSGRVGRGLCKVGIKFLPEY